MICFSFLSSLIESNKIRDSGGYNFSQSALAGPPTNFNFGGSLNTSFQNSK